MKVKIQIPSYKSIEPIDGTRSYYVYTIHITVHSNGTYRTYFVERRYSDFLQLHNLLRRQYETPIFPPKRVRNSRAKVLEYRRTALEYYLQIMTDLSQVSREVLQFLEIESPRYSMNNCWKRDSRPSIDSSSNPEESSEILLNPAAAFFEDPFIESDSSSNLSDSVTRGVLDALYH